MEAKIERTSVSHSRELWRDRITILLFSLLLFNVFHLIKIKPFQEIALKTVNWTMYITATLLIISLFLLRKRTQQLKWLFIGALIYFIINFITNLFNGGLFENPDFFVPILCIMFFLMSIYWPISKRALVGFGHISQACIILIFIDWLNKGLPLNQFKSFFWNPNISGIFFGTLLIFIGLGIIASTKLITRIYFSIGILLSLALIYASTSRSVYLILIIMLASYAINKWFSHRFKQLFIIVMSLNLAFVFVYNYLSLTKIGTRINDWSVEHFQKNFFSGRQEIWGPSLEHGLKAPFTGHGVGILPKDYMEGTRYAHSHNEYVQIFLESGLFGLAAFIFFLWIIWRMLLKSSDEPISRFVSYFMVGLLFYQSVELTLFFNLQSIGLLQWFILAIGVQFALKEKRTQIE